MGDLTVGGYKVCGLTYDEAKGGYYRDYSADGLSAHFTAVSGGVATMDADYTLGVNKSTGTPSSLLVKIDNGNLSATNNFALGNMPFDCVSTFDTTTSDIKAVSNNDATVNDDKCYNLAGQRVSTAAKGIVIRNGRKFINK